VTQVSARGDRARLIWLKRRPGARGSLGIPWSAGCPMRKFALKAIFTLLTLDRAERRRIDWDRTILIFSSAVTAGLVALYIYGKSTSRW
jgi:hypothetical protein